MIHGCVYQQTRFTRRSQLLRKPNGHMTINKPKSRLLLGLVIHSCVGRKSQREKATEKVQKSKREGRGSLGWGLGEEILADKHKQVQGT